MTRMLLTFGIPLALFLTASRFEQEAHAGVPFTIKASYENPSSGADFDLFSLLPDGSILAEAVNESVIRIDQNGQLLASASVPTFLNDWYFSRDPATGHLYVADSFASQPKFYDLDSNLQLVSASNVPAYYFGSNGSVSWSEAFLSDGSEVRFAESRSSRKLFLLDAQKQVLLEKDVNETLIVSRTGADGFVTLAKLATHSHLTTYDHQGHVLLERDIPERDCHRVNVIDQKYPEEPAFACEGGSVVQLDRNGLILDRHHIDPDVRYCEMSGASHLVTCRNGSPWTSNFRTDLWSSVDWTLKKRFAAPGFEWAYPLKSGLVLQYSNRDSEILNKDLQVVGTIERPVGGRPWWFGAASGTSIPFVWDRDQKWFFRINSLIDGSLEFDLEPYQIATGLSAQIHRVLKISDDAYVVAMQCTYQSRVAGLCSRGRILIVAR